MMKIFTVLAVCLAVVSGVFADKTGIAIYNTGKDAVLKVKKNGGLRVSERVFKDRKTGAQTACCVFFNVYTRNSKPRKISLTIEAAAGDLTVYIGNKKTDFFNWSSVKIDGKEQIKNKKGEIFNARVFKIGKIAKRKDINIEFAFRPSSRKEANAYQKAQREKDRSKRSAKSSKKSSKKSDSSKK